MIKLSTTQNIMALGRKELHKLDYRDQNTKTTKTFSVFSCLDSPDLQFPAIWADIQNNPSLCVCGGWMKQIPKVPSSYKLSVPYLLEIQWKQAVVGQISARSNLWINPQPRFICSVCTTLRTRSFLWKPVCFWIRKLTMGLGEKVGSMGR